MTQHPQRINKLWGHEEVIINTDRYCGKVLVINPGFRSSLHYHKDKDETFLVMDGVVSIELRDQETNKRTIVTLRAADKDFIRLTPGTPHRFWAVNETATVVEFSTPHSDEDVYRLEDSYEVKTGFRR